MNPRDSQDLRSAADVREPPRTFLQTLRFLGPGLIVTGSIVGSGELIVTTRLGAEIGFVLLWFVILSCIIKTFVQIELGRHTIGTGETTMDAFNRVPGPRFRASWLVWWWPVMVFATLLQLGGIIGGVAQVLQVVAPLGDHRIWTIPVAISGIAILVRGRYGRVEKVTTFLVFLFTAVTVIDGLLLQGTSYALRREDLFEGFSFRVPSAGVTLAFAAFGITGVGATELVFYPYWCIEKGYARYTGPRNEDPRWTERARGWVRVLKTDAWVATGVFTVATIAFYALGAAVLHAREQIPEKAEMITTLSQMYTETIGKAGMTIFLVGAFAVLYSTFFVSTASHARVMTDCLRVLGFVRYRDSEERMRWVDRFVIAFAIIYCVSYWIAVEPVLLVLIGATFQAITLPFIAGAAVYLRYRHRDVSLRPRPLTDLLLWIAFIGMVVVSIYQGLDQIRTKLSG